MRDLAGSLGLVTGASGFIGRGLLRALPSGVTVYATYRGDESFPAWAHTCAADVRSLRIDLARDRLGNALRDRLDWSILMAARVDLKRSRADPMGDVAAICGPAVNAALGLQTDQIVHLSTGSVYETLSGRLGPERVPEPHLPYSIGKLSAELLVNSVAEAPVWTARFFGAYGPGEPEFKLIRRMVDAFRRGESRFSLTGDGRNRIDVMYIEDAARMLIGLLRTPGSGVLDLCQGESLTIAEFARVAFNSVHPNPTEADLDLSFGGVAHEKMLGIADPATADALLGVQRLSLRDGLMQYAKWLEAEARH